MSAPHPSRRSRSRALAVAGALCVAAAGAATWFRPPFALVRLVAKASREVLFFVPTSERAIALTFDDGPHPETTPPILDALARHGARATFFVVGERCREHPRLVERIAAEGHELANHTWAVERTASLAPERLERSIADTQALLAERAPVTLMRPGSGWFNRTVLEASRRHGLRCVLGSVYPHDPLFTRPGYSTQYVLSRARPGAIVILHEGEPRRARVTRVLDAVLPKLGERGYRVTTVTDLLESGDTAR